jgi:hypothetical protein
LPNRIIKESICTSGNIENLKPEEEVFFYRVLVNCDDYGRTDARPQILRAKCYPLKTDRIKIPDIEKWLSSLIREGLIILYHADGGTYLQVVTWDKHQQIRAKRSKYPAFDGDCKNLISHDINCNQMNAYVPVIQSNPIQSESESESIDHQAEFENWWKQYPRKIGKADALKEWIKLRKSGVSAEQLTKGLENYNAEVKRLSQEPKYILHGRTFLGPGKRWEDYLNIEGGGNGGHPNGDSGDIDPDRTKWDNYDYKKDAGIWSEDDA